MNARLATTMLLAALLSTPAFAADCGTFETKLAKADALDKAQSRAFEERRTAESCRLMAEVNAIRDDILKSTHDDCYTATRSKIMIRMNHQTTAAVFKAMCGRP